MFKSIAVSVLGLAFIVATTVPVSAAVPGDTTGKTVKHVCLDPGHGGTAPGAVYGGIKESDLNLSVAFKVSDKLIANGFAVDMTRTDDSTLSNSDRYNFCNSTAATSLVSIHHNASTDTSVDYSIGLYGQRKSIELTETVNAAVATAVGNRNAGIDRFASGLLLKSDMPSMISEGYFLSNEKRQVQLQDPVTREELEHTEAQAIVDGLIQYYTL